MVVVGDAFEERTVDLLDGRIVGGAAMPAHLVRRRSTDEVVQAMADCTPFGVDEFEAAFADPVARDAVLTQLWKTVESLFRRLITYENAKYLQKHIFPLPIWADEPEQFARLQSMAQAASDPIIAEARAARDAGLSASAAEAEIRGLASIDGAVEQPIPSGFFRMAGQLTGDRRERLEDDIVAGALQLRAEEAREPFTTKLLELLPGAAVASHIPEMATNDSTEPRLLYVAPVKGAARMKDKIREYREKHGSFDSDGGGGIALLGDLLRCTVECATFDEVWTTVQQVKAGFKLRPGNGRLKNSMLTTKPKPPDMLLNVLFEAPSGFAITAEIQIHLRAVHVLKQEEHVLYEVRRVESGAVLCAAYPGASRVVIAGGGGAAAGGAPAPR